MIYRLDKTITRLPRMFKGTFQKKGTEENMHLDNVSIWIRLKIDGGKNKIFACRINNQSVISFSQYVVDGTMPITFFKIVFIKNIYIHNKKYIQREKNSKCEK